jgi:hypothetical protein
MNLLSQVVISADALGRVVMVEMMDVRLHGKESTPAIRLRQLSSTADLAAFSMGFIGFSYGTCARAFRFYDAGVP